MVARDAEWKYFKGRSGPPPVQNGIDWTATDYDDSHRWGGPVRGGFGYGEKYEKGVLEDMKNQYATLYIRHRFTVDDPSEITRLTLAVDYDDGFAAYINGREVARRNLPDDIIGHDTTALESHEASRGRGKANPQEKEYIRIDPTTLKAGTNLIAISGHNVHLSSSDFYLEAELSANTNLVRGPYIQMPTKDGVTIVWDTDAETVGTVDFGLDRNVSEGRVGETDAVRHHAITLDNLLPGRIYFYRLSSGDTPHAESYSLRVPSAPDQAYRFAVIGDFGYPDHHSTVAVANQVNKHEPDYLLTVGDNIYQHGQPGHYDSAWFTPYGVTMARGPTFPALGNHDIESENGRWFLEYFHLPENGPAGHKERNYSFDYGNAHVAVVDSNPFDRQVDAVMNSIASWLEDDLNRTDKPWKLVTLHHALHASPGSRGIEPRLRDLLAPIFESTGVQIVFQGHNHWYERSNPVNGVHYITTGAGGLSLHEAGQPNRYSAKLEDDLYSFVLVDVDGDQLSLQAIGEDGKAFDKLHLDLGHPFKMDGLLDEPSWKRASNGLDLYAAIRDNILYVAVQDAGAGSDHFIFVAEDTGPLQSAAWAKSRVSKNAIFGPNSLPGFWTQRISLMIPIRPGFGTNQ